MNRKYMCNYLSAVGISIHPCNLSDSEPETAEEKKYYLPLSELFDMVESYPVSIHYIVNMNKLVNNAKDKRETLNRVYTSMCEIVRKSSVAEHATLYNTLQYMNHKRNVVSRAIGYNFHKGTVIPSGNAVVTVDRKEEKDSNGNTIIHVTITETERQQTREGKTGKVKSSTSAYLPTVVRNIDSKPERVAIADGMEDIPLFRNYAVVDVGKRVPYVKKDGSLSEHKTVYNGSLETIGKADGKTMYNAYMLLKENKLSVQYADVALVPFSVMELAFFVAYKTAERAMNEPDYTERQEQIYLEYVSILSAVLSFGREEKPFYKTSEHVKREFIEINGKLTLCDVRYREETNQLRTVDDVINDKLRKLSVDSYEYFSSACVGILKPIQEKLKDKDGKIVSVLLRKPTEYEQRMNGFSAVNEHIQAERGNSVATTTEFIEKDGKLWNMENAIARALNGRAMYLKTAEEEEEEQRKEIQAYNERVKFFHRAARHYISVGQLTEEDVSLLNDVASARLTYEEIANKHGLNGRYNVVRKMDRIRGLLVRFMEQEKTATADKETLFDMVKDGALTIEELHVVAEFKRNRKSNSEYKPDKQTAETLSHIRNRIAWYQQKHGQHAMQTMTDKSIADSVTEKQRKQREQNRKRKQEQRKREKEQRKREQETVNA